jgi:1,4-alpha-glucan branching enzyme
MALLKEGPYTGRIWEFGRGSFETVSNPMWGLANVLAPVPFLPAPYMSVRYIASHDERHVVDEVERDGSADAKSLGGIRKAKLGAMALFTATGMPMFYMGEEIGDGSFIPDVPAPNKLNWEEGDSGLRAVYRNLIGLRLEHPSLATGRIEFFCPSWSSDQSPCQENKTINYWRFVGQNAANTDVVVALNFDHADHEMTIEFPASGTWYQFDPETGANIETPVENGELTRVLSASTGEIYLKTAWTP